MTLDFDFFESDITDTGTSTRIDHGEEEIYSVTMHGSVLKLAREPLAGTGGLLWPAGETLARYLTTQGHLFKDKAVLELGSGTGIVGLCVAKMCHPSSVTLTDLKKVFRCHASFMTLTDFKGDFVSVILHDIN